MLRVILCMCVVKGFGETRYCGALSATAFREMTLLYLACLLALMKIESIAEFVISSGVISCFRCFPWRIFVISSFRVAFFRFYASP